MPRSSKRQRPKNARKTAHVSGPNKKNNLPGRSASKPSGALPGVQNQQKQKKKQQQQQQQQQQQHQKPVIPFSPEHAILLVGEGDLSFAASLVQHHGCENVTATVLERDLAELTEKYPHVADNVHAIESRERCKVVYGIDSRKMGPFGRKRGGKSSSSLSSSSSPPPPAAASSSSSSGSMDRIIFNFPHVGGKSTDVNRQVRYNQEMLVDFFARAQLSLTPGGAIVVTLFEGEPYTLWNIRDLARHAGLQVDRSFRFAASAYPGYHHARTLGVVRNKQGETGGGWKGEDRPARSYIFVRKGETLTAVVPSKKRKRQDNDSTDDDDDDDDD